jgi:hypothetical protein
MEKPERLVKDLANKISFKEISNSFVAGLAARMNSNKVEFGGKYGQMSFIDSNPIDLIDAIKRHLQDLEEQLNNKPEIHSKGENKDTIKDNILAIGVNANMLFEVCKKLNKFYF